MDADHCYRALCARDRRFDGVFFVAVETTGIYCRPICPARTPGRARCRFFARAAEAEQEGFRACFRCRPERAPGLAAVDSTPRLVQRALARIASGALDDGSVDDVAEELGVSGRHLRRAVEAAIGVSPIALAQTRRLGAAKWLIQDTALPLTDVAYAAGFASIRRFNAAFRERFGCAPTELRRGRAETTGSDAVTLRLETRAPFAGKELLAFLRGRAIPSVEAITETTYRRFARVGKCEGWIDAKLDPASPAIVARIDTKLLPELTEVVARLRALFDLDAHPDRIDTHLALDPALAPHVARVPGLRVPGAFDAWELAVRAVLGQQVSVRGATTVSCRLVEMFGEKIAGGGHRFPSAEILAAASVDEVRKIGIPGARAATVVALAQAIAKGDIDMSPGADPDEVIALLDAVRGIGPWTAGYIAMRALRAPDTFLGDDLAAKKALGVTRAKDADRLSERWRPWRAYALMHLWSSLSQGG